MNKDEETADALVEAAFDGDALRLVALLRTGVSPNVMDTEGTTPLYAAAISGHADVVRLLLAASADPNVESRGPGEGIPLCAAACWGHSDVVRELLGHGADPNLREHDGPQTDEESPEGMVALHWASQNGHVETVRRLLVAGADPNLKYYGGTPLLMAVERGSVETVRALLEAGADTAIVDEEGRLPLEVAEEWSSKDIASDLRTRVQVDRVLGASVQLLTRREPLPGGSELIEVELRSADGGGFSVKRETGHAQIVEILQQWGTR